MVGMAEERMSDSVDSQMQIGQEAQWIGKAPLGTVSTLDQGWCPGAAGNRS